MARIFISHADGDERVARRIAETLRDAGHHPLLKVEIPTGSSIPSAMADALDTCDFVVVCLSLASVASGWVKGALDIAIMGQLDRDQTRVLPVRLEEVTPPSQIAHLKYDDLFPAEEGFRRGTEKLLWSIAVHAQQAPPPLMSPVAGPPPQCPDLQGTWKGTILSDWKDPTTGRKLDPISVFMIVRQQGTRLRMRLLSPESQSSSMTATADQESDGQWSINGTYQNEPAISVRSRSPIHRGGIRLHLGGMPPNTTMSGTYWTDRKTAGDISLRRASRETADDYATAILLAGLADGGDASS